MFVDATNPRARKYVWYKCKKNYFDAGIRIFWLDEAEPEYGTYDFKNYRYHLGSNQQIGNLYPQAYARTFYEGMKEAILAFDRKIKGFAHPDAVLTGVETRSSSPVRVLRDGKTMQSEIAGLYPAGEGAGYAGGILSAAVDGIRAGESFLREEK